MIAKVTRGDDAGGLVRYLLGGGRSNEHVDQRVIATSPGIEVDLGATVSTRQRQGLVAQLETPRAIYGGGPAKGNVYHLSLSNPPADRVLDDAEWAAIVTETMTDLGFSGDRVASAPWAAFRHGAGASEQDHVHVAVTMVREDGGRVSTSNDYRTLSATCRRMEQRYGLSIVEGRTAGAGRGLSRAELELSERTGQAPDRDRLTRSVRAAAASSVDEAEFVRRLRDGGVMVRPRFASDDPSRVTGFAVSLGEERGLRGPHPDSLTVKPGERRWFAAGKLAKDLSLPALRAGWSSVADEPSAWTGQTPPGREAVSGVEDAVFAGAARRSREATEALAGVDPQDHQRWAEAARDAAGVHAQLAARLDADGQGGSHAELAEILARSAQMGDHRNPRVSSLQGVAAVAAQAATLASKGSGAGWAIVAAELARLAAAIAKAHQARQELDRARHVVAAATAVAPDRSGPVGGAVIGRTEELGRTPMVKPPPKPGPERGFER